MAPGAAARPMQTGNPSEGSFGGDGLSQWACSLKYTRSTKALSRAYNCEGPEGQMRPQFNASDLLKTELGQVERHGAAIA